MTIESAIDADLSIPLRNEPTAGGEYPRQSFSNEAAWHFDAIADDFPRWQRKMGFYSRSTVEFLSAAVPANQSVLMVGCLSSEILPALKPSRALGIDVSRGVIQRAKTKSQSPNIRFECTTPEACQTQETFDYILVINVLDHVQDVFTLLDSLRRFCHPETRLIISSINPLWHNLARLASSLGLRIPDTRRNLVANRVVKTALAVKSFRVDDVFRRVLIPRKVPFVSWFVNQFLARLPIFNSLCFMNYVCARPVWVRANAQPSCSVVVPCYNEQDNIEECVRRVPKFGGVTEVVIVNDGSSDHTERKARQLSEQFEHVRLVTYRKNRGKGHAVKTGIRAAGGDIVMILDADMTVPPEELTEFYEALANRTADFVNGTRFLYPMEREAMRLSNFFGNILFSKLVGIIISADCSDTLCGTKAMWRRDFHRLEFEDSRWGDFDLIFHAANASSDRFRFRYTTKAESLGNPKCDRFRPDFPFSVYASTSGLSYLREILMNLKYAWIGLLLLVCSPAFAGRKIAKVVSWQDTVQGYGPWQVTGANSWRFPSKEIWVTLMNMGDSDQTVTITASLKDAHFGKGFSNTRYFNSGLGFRKISYPVNGSAVTTNASTLPVTQVASDLELGEDSFVHVGFAVDYINMNESSVFLLLTGVVKIVVEVDETEGAITGTVEVNGKDFSGAFYHPTKTNHYSAFQSTFMAPRIQSLTTAAAF